MKIVQNKPRVKYGITPQRMEQIRLMINLFKFEYLLQEWFHNNRLAFYREAIKLYTKKEENYIG